MGLLEQDTLGMDTHAQTQAHVVFNAAPSDRGVRKHSITSGRCSLMEVLPHTTIQGWLDQNRM